MNRKLAFKIVFLFCCIAIGSCTQIITNENGGTSNSGSGSGGDKPAPTPGTTPGGDNPSPTPGDTTKPPAKDSTISNVDINISFTSPCAPSSEVFTFTSLVKGIPAGATYEWYFGDGKSSVGTTSTVTHSYQYGGTVTVEMKITSGGKTQADISKVIKPAGQNVSPIAEFYTQTNDPTNAPNVYTFNSQAQATQGFILKSLWNFGDGATSTQGSPTHSYAQTPADQTFVAILTVTGSIGGCTSSASHDIFIPAKYTVTGSFSYTSTNQCAPSHEVFTFTSNHTGVPSNAVYKWDFSDGSPAAYGKQVTHTFTYKNTYNVSLTITYNGLTIYAEQQAVKTYGQDTNPQAGFYMQATTQTTYSFNSTNSIGGGYSLTKYEWNLGDGTYSNQPNVLYHVFPKSPTNKTYTISFKITASSGCTDLTSQTLDIPAN